MMARVAIRPTDTQLTYGTGPDRMMECCMTRSSRMRVRHTYHTASNGGRATTNMAVGISVYVRFTIPPVKYMCQPNARIAMPSTGIGCM